MADAVIWPRVNRMGYLVLVLGLVLIAAIVAIGSLDAGSLIPIFLGMVMAAGGGQMVWTEHRARTHPVSFALTREAVWRRVAPDKWTLLVRLAQIRRLEAGTDNIKYAGEMHAGASLLLVDDAHATFDVGPLPDPMSWVETISRLCADMGVPLEAYVHPWVPKYNPPASSGSVTEQALQPDASRAGR